MNYWERYGGDYARDTAHLNLAENGAYSLLLDVQYSTERGLPEPYDALARICRAAGKVEQSAVRTVADQYFPVGPDGLRWNPRAAREIEKAQKRIEASRVNGKHGGRKPGRNPAGSRQVPDRNPMGSPSATRPGEALPHAIPQPQSFSTKDVENGVATQLSGKPDESLGETKPKINGTAADVKTKRAAQLAADAREILEFLNEKAGRKFPSTESNVGIIVARFREGFTPTQLRQVVAIKVRAWKGNEEMVGYLRPDTLFGRRKFSNYVGEIVDVPEDSDA